MDHEDAVALLRPGVGSAGGTWADLGAGRGVFARALSELLGPTGTVYALDRDARALASVGAGLARGAPILTRQGDFTRPIALPPLDGLLLANSLHFVARQDRVLHHLAALLEPRGRLLLVEYDETQRSPWNPFPIPPARFKRLVAASGLSEPLELNRRRSRFGHRDLYVALATKL